MKVTDAHAALVGTRPIVACDFSPPRSADVSFTRAVSELEADFLCVAYAPGRSVRLGSVAAAAIIHRETGKDTIFNLVTRDMNRLAIQTHLLEAQALGLENVLVLRGDPFSERDLLHVQPASGFTPTELLESIGLMNGGTDFRGTALHRPTALCAGAAIDLDQPLQEQATLTWMKVQAGAEFFVTQPVYGPSRLGEFHELYQSIAAEPLRAPVFYGVAVLVKDGVIFGSVPETVRVDLDKGRAGADIALEIVDTLMGVGCDAFYVVPPIMRGGARDYTLAQPVLQALRRGQA